MTSPITEIRRLYANCSLDADIAKAAASAAAESAQAADRSYKEAVDAAALAAIDAAAGDGPAWSDHTAAEVWSYAHDAADAATQAARHAGQADNAARLANKTFESCEILMVESEPNPEDDPDDDDRWLHDNAAEALTYHDITRAAAKTAAAHAAAARQAATLAEDHASSAEQTARQR